MELHCNACDKRLGKNDLLVDPYDPNRTSLCIRCIRTIRESIAFNDQQQALIDDLIIPLDGEDEDVD